MKLFKKVLENLLDDGNMAAEKLVAEIHADFDQAEDRLLQQANSILNAANVAVVNPVTESKATRLQNLGFAKTSTVKKHKDELEKSNQEKLEKEEAEKQAKLIVYYKQTYPFLKFLTIDELDKLCAKYNLIWSDVQFYIKDVPEKNLVDIEKAQPLKIQDTPGSKLRNFGQIDTQYDAIFTTLRSRNTKPTDAQIEEMVYQLFNVVKPVVNPTSDVSAPLFIAAPKSHFDLKGMRQKAGFEYGLRPEPKDPIVFRKVRGGIQVITKWGLEAEDSSLLNEINN